MTVSLLISTYNWPEALSLSFRSILNQTRFPDEVVIADDGSREETRQLVEAFKGMAPFTVKHVWQEDEGFRLAAIRNKAIAQCTSDYIVQIDGDIILHPDFIKNHTAAAKRGFFVRGTRVLLSERLTPEVLWNRPLKRMFFSSEVKKRFNTLHLPALGRMTTFLYNPRHCRHLTGCNMAFWRKDLIRVNGYNEDISGWGGEDNEIAARLINSGIYKRVIRWGMNAYHIYHPSNSKERLSTNKDILQEVISKKKTLCQNGLDKYLP